jgi:hypothetical protein
MSGPLGGNPAPPRPPSLATLSRADTPPIRYPG